MFITYLAVIHFLLRTIGNIKSLDKYQFLLKSFHFVAVKFRSSALQRDNTRTGVLLGLYWLTAHGRCVCGGVEEILPGWWGPHMNISHLHLNILGLTCACKQRQGKVPKSTQERLLSRQALTDSHCALWQHRKVSRRWGIAARLLI